VKPAGKPLFTPAQVEQIRLEKKQGTLDVKAWCRALDCGAETVRRIARGETYNRTPVPFTEPAPADVLESFRRLHEGIAEARRPAETAAEVLLNLMEKK
jgi:hypothetical protein